MSQYEPYQILDNVQTVLPKESNQQFVQLGGTSIFMGLKDGMRYNLLPTPDNKFKLIQIPDDDTCANVSSSYSDSYQDSTKCVDLNTPPNKFQSLQLVTSKKELPTPCRGQGDESGNSVLSTPDSTSPHKNPEFFVGGPHPTYTTLMTKQEQKLDTNLYNANYIIPASYFQFPSPMRRGTSSSRAARSTKCHQKLRLATPRNFSPICSPIPFKRGRGHRQRRPRQPIYQYRYPFLHSTPTSSSSYSVSPIIPVASSSVNVSSEDQKSLEYPRVPNNTPTSENEDSRDKPKILNLQWIPKIEPQTFDYTQMDPRESHSKDEQQRRVPNNTPTSENDDSSDKPNILNLQWIPKIESQIDAYMQMDPRESHNEKERQRRLRIKNACQFMKNLLPRVCNKTDNATVFENAVHFITFMRETVGIGYDMEFLQKSSSSVSCIY